MSIASVKRIKGRPVRGEGDVGRDKLIEAARSILRMRPAPELSRKAVADAAGVTPPLVSYYFPDKSSLFLAVTRALAGERIDQLHAIIDSPDSRHGRLRALVGLFVSLNEAESHLIDNTIAWYHREDADSAQRAPFEAAYRRLRAFYLEGVAAGDWRSLDPDLVLFALWGMCKFVAQSGGVVTGEAAVASRGQGSHERIAMIADLALNGLRGLPG